MSIRAQIISIAFISNECYYCDNPWKYKLEVETIDSKTEELTGNTVDIYACQDCRDTKFTAFEERVTVVFVKDALQHQG